MTFLKEVTVCVFKCTLIRKDNSYIRRYPLKPSNLNKKQTNKKSFNVWGSWDHMWYLHVSGAVPEVSQCTSCIKAQVIRKESFWSVLGLHNLSFNCGWVVGLEPWAMLASPLAAIPITQWVVFSRMNQLRAIGSSSTIENVCFLSTMLMIICSLKWITTFSGGITYQWKYQ